MKQQITQQQWDALPIQSKLKYLSWAKNQQSVYQDYNRLYRSIDDLIQFIDDHIINGWWRIERDGSKAGWRVQHAYIEFDEDDEPELIDALWSAVKVLLEDDKKESEDCITPDGNSDE